MDQTSKFTQKLVSRDKRRSLQERKLPAAETQYLEQVVAVLQSQLGQQLVGAYLFGSAGYGDYTPGVSDLDVQAVISEGLEEKERYALAAALAHAKLPCPARCLEFVCYRQSAVNPASRRPQFELNFNTGFGVETHLSLDSGEEASHWFLLDIAMGRELGQCLVGVDPAQVFASIPRLWQLKAILESLNWHCEHEPRAANTVLNACRGWRYAVKSIWGSKLSGAAWALTQLECPTVVAQATAHRVGGPGLNRAAIADLMAIVTEAVQAAIVQEGANSLCSQQKWL